MIHTIKTTTASDRVIEDPFRTSTLFKISKPVESKLHIIPQLAYLEAAHHFTNISNHPPVTPTPIPVATITNHIFAASNKGARSPLRPSFE